MQSAPHVYLIVVLGLPVVLIAWVIFVRMTARRQAGGTRTVTRDQRLSRGLFVSLYAVIAAGVFAFLGDDKLLAGIFGMYAGFCLALVGWQKWQSARTARPAGKLKEGAAE